MQRFNYCKLLWFKGNKQKDLLQLCTKKIASRTKNNVNSVFLLLARFMHI